MCGCVYHVLISISGEDGKALHFLLSGRSWVCERGCFLWDSLRKTKKARMNDCHWDSEGDVYGCHSRMNMETHCMHLISDKDSFEFLHEVHLILSFWDLIICGDNVSLHKMFSVLVIISQADWQSCGYVLAVNIVKKPIRPLTERALKKTVDDDQFIFVLYIVSVQSVLKVKWYFNKHIVM